jgi:hypothetical protein
MHYYRCSTEQLQLEAQRRGYATSGTRDQLGEALKKDDNDRGTDASTVKTESLGNFAPRELNLSRTAEFGQTTPAMMLVNESMWGYIAPYSRADRSRNRVLDDEHILSDPAAILRVRPLLHS